MVSEEAELVRQGVKVFFDLVELLVYVAVLLLEGFLPRFVVRV